MQRILKCAYLPLLMACSAAESNQQQRIDIEKSTMMVHVSKSGVLSAFGHDHDIKAPIASGTVDQAAHRVELRVATNALRVVDREASEKDRAEIQKTMLGSEGLDAAQYREIVFRSDAAEPAGTGAWSVRGILTLHGVSRPVTVNVSEKSGHYVGGAPIKQSDFGMKPVKAAGGTVKTKDEVRIEFDIQLAR